MFPEAHFMFLPGNWDFVLFLPPFNYHGCTYSPLIYLVFFQSSLRAIIIPSYGSEFHCVTNCHVQHFFVSISELAFLVCLCKYCTFRRGRKEYGLPRTRQKWYIFGVRNYFGALDKLLVSIRILFLKKQTKLLETQKQTMMAKASPDYLFTTSGIQKYIASEQAFI